MLRSTGLLLAALGLLSIANHVVAASGDELPANPNWDYFATINHHPDPKSPPKHDFYLGRATLVNLGEKNPKKKIYVQWFRAVFQELQTFDGVVVKSEVFEEKIDCPHLKYQVLRDIRYGRTDEVVFDKVGKTPSLPFVIEGNLYPMPLGEEFAKASASYNCVPADGD